jgi:glycogen synthase
MRVLLISWEYPPIIEGGLARHVRKLSEHLVAEGVEMHVLTRGGGRLPATEERHGVVVHRLEEPPFPKDVGAFVRWVEAMNADMRELGQELVGRLGFDLVHSHDWLVAGAAEQIARRSGLPWLVTVHATEYGRHQGWVQKYPQSHIHAAERAMVRHADHVITCSRYMRSHVADVFGIPTAKITAMQNGIDPGDLEPVA